MPIYKMKGKKDGLQKYRVRINYLDAYGKAKQIDRVIHGIEEAKNLERELTQSVKEESPSKRMTLQMLFDEYIAAKKHEVRESTLDKSRHILELHVLPTLKDTKLKKLTIPVLQKWKLHIEEKKIDDSKTADKTLSLIMKQNIFGQFRALLNYAVKLEYLPTNPLSKLGNFKSTATVKKEMDFYSADEFKKFITAAREAALDAETHDNMHEWNYYVFFAIAFYSGLRKGEIHGLHWDDIKDGYLSVKRSIAQKIKGGDRETAPKNASSIRTLQMPEPLICILDDHYKRCSTIEGFQDTYYVCGGPSCLRDNTIWNRSKEYSDQAGLKQIRIHDFRHSHASLLANEGINIQEIARRLGHSKIEITWNTYSHLYPREEERAVQILNKIVLKTCTA